MVALQTTWSWLPAIYLFLGGLSAGAFLTVSILRLARPGCYGKVVMRGSWVAVVALAVGLLALISEVEKPFAAVNLIASFSNFGSVMAIGAWLLLVAFVVFVLGAVFSTDKLVAALGKPFEKAQEKAGKVLACIGVPVSIAVAVYTGILLGAAPAIPLWGTWLLPVLFTVSAFDTGVAAVAIAVALEKGDEAHKLQVLLEKLTVVLVVLEMVVLAAFVLTMQGGSADEARSIGVLTGGALAPQFWLLVVAVGLAVPLLAALTQIVAASKGKEDQSIAAVAPLAGAACALVGGFTLRFVVLAAGLHAAVVGPDALQAAAGILMLL